MKYFPNLYLMHNAGGRSSWQHLQATYHMGLTVPYTTEVVSQIASKMTNFGCPLSKYNELDPAIWGETCIAYRVCQNLPLLHSSGGRCFWHHLYTTCGSQSHHTISPQDWLSNIFENTRVWVHPLSTTNGMLFYKERHPLLLKWFKPFHSIDMEVWHMRGASDSICKPPVCLTVPFSTVRCGWHSSCLQNSRFWVPSQYRKLGWYSARRDIHCSWSVS